MAVNFLTFATWTCFNAYFSWVLQEEILRAFFFPEWQILVSEDLTNKLQNGCYQVLFFFFFLKELQHLLLHIELYYVYKRNVFCACSARSNKAFCLNVLFKRLLFPPTRFSLAQFRVGTETFHIRGWWGHAVHWGFQALLVLLHIEHGYWKMYLNKHDLARFEQNAVNLQCTGCRDSPLSSSFTFHRLLDT